MNPDLIPCGLALLISAVFNVLHRAFHVSCEAGLGRFRERSNRTARTIDRWEPRVASISGMLLFLAGVAQISAVWFAVNVHDSLRLEQPQLAWIWVAGFTFLFILFVRVLPPALSSHYADRITVSVLPSIGLLSQVLFPVSFVMQRLEMLVTLQVATNSREAHRPSAEDEILNLVDLSEADGLEEDEKEIIRSALEFGDTITREIMTPRVNMTGVEDTLNVLEVVELIMDSPYSRFPVYHEDYDEILGMVHAKDLMKAIARKQGEATVTSLMRPPLFTPESMPINDLLQLMRHKKTQTAIAVDEYGGTAGIITLEDILEELVGEIEDEHDDLKVLFSSQTDGSYLVDPTIPIDEVNEALSLSIPESDTYDSLGGYLLLKFGCIPEEGDHIREDSVEFTVETATARRVERVRILLDPARDPSV